MDAETWWFGSGEHHRNFSNERTNVVLNSMRTQCWSDRTVRPDVRRRLHTFVRIKITDKRRQWAVSHRRVFFDPETSFSSPLELHVIDPKVQIINKKC